MKRVIRGVTVLGVMLGVPFAVAEEGHRHDMAPPAQAGTQTVTGEVVDLACYLGHGAQGAEHRDCAQKCISSGLPVGIKSGDTIYLAVGGEHGTANATLAPLAGKQVTAEGAVSERDGVHLIAIQKVAAQS